MTTSVVILGAGFGGLELATRLSDDLAGEVSVTLIDKSDSFIFGYSKLAVMFGLAELDGVRAYYRDVYVVPADQVPNDVATGDLVLDDGLANYRRRNERLA